MPLPLIFLYIRLILDNNTQCKRWYDRIIEAIKPSLNFTDTFAFIHYAYLPPNAAARLTTQRGEGKISFVNNWCHVYDTLIVRNTCVLYLTIGVIGNVAMATAMLTSEYRRMGLDLPGTWRITECNTKYGYG